MNVERLKNNLPIHYFCQNCNKEIDTHVKSLLEHNNCNISVDEVGGNLNELLLFCRYKILVTCDCGYTTTLFETMVLYCQNKKDFDETFDKLTFMSESLFMKTNLFGEKV